jgi:TetR/AcrR family transcriptional repressor of nem operon
MPRDGSSTRERILDAAEKLILEQGFSATSLDRLVQEAGITKGSFFYHFKSKADLATALVERYARLDRGHLEESLARAEELSRDPLQQLIIFVGLFEEKAAQLTEPYPGCLFASYCYESQLFDERTLGVIRDAMLAWRARLGEKLEQIEQTREPKLPVDRESLADMITVIFEGAFILSKTLGSPAVVARQLRHFRNYLELLYGD